jgi:hypothetical protein
MFFFTSIVGYAIVSSIPPGKSINNTPPPQPNTTSTTPKK